MIYNDNCDTEVFNAWIELSLLLETQKLQLLYPSKRIHLVMDNVPYHKSNTTEELLSKNNIHLVFQPPYSPDLNPIEPSWTHTKNDIRKLSYTNNLTFIDKLCNSLNSRSVNL